MAITKTNEIEKTFSDFITQLEIRKVASVKFITEIKSELHSAQ